MSASTTSPTTADPEILHPAARQLQMEAKRDHGVFVVFIILNVVVLVMWITLDLFLHYVPSWLGPFFTGFLAVIYTVGIWHMACYNCLYSVSLRCQQKPTLPAQQISIRSVEEHHLSEIRKFDKPLLLIPEQIVNGVPENKGRPAIEEVLPQTQYYTYHVDSHLSGCTLILAKDLPCLQLEAPKPEGA